MFRIVYEIAIAVGVLYLIIWLVMTLVGQARRQGVQGRDPGDPGTSALLTQDDRGHHHPGGGHHHHGDHGIGGHGDGGGGDGGSSH
jgi:hypothetical protein